MIENKSKFRIPLYILIYVLLIIWAILTGYPLIWMVLSSLKDNVSFLIDPWSLPTDPRFENFVIAWQAGIQGFFLNSVFVTVLTTGIIILLSCAFSFMAARFPFKGSTGILGMFFAGMMVPVHVTLIPLFIMMNRLNWLDGRFTLLFPYVGFGLPIAIFLTYAHYRQIPKELEDAAIIDGCGIYSLFAFVFFPLAKPVIFTVSILSAMSAWNEFIFANVFITSQSLRTLPVGLMVFRGTYVTNFALMSAALVISAVPIIILYICMSGRLQTGLIAGSIKG